VPLARGTGEGSTVTSFDDIGFLLMDVAKMCNVDAARIVSGEAIEASLASPDQSGFHVVGSEAFQAPDGTQARILLLSRERRSLTVRECTALRAMALHAQLQMG
jgi:hypothetical protein